MASKPLGSFENASKMSISSQQDPPEGADDLRAFLAEAQTQPEPAPELEDEEVQEAAGDLAAFLREAKADGERAEMPPVRHLAGLDLTWFRWPNGYTELLC